MDDKGPLVSIVTPSYNQAGFLEETIRSVLNQDFPNIEYIIIDGGSSDGSLDIIRKYEDRLAYWVSEQDRGSSEAVNKGWRRSQGDYIWILSSDDMLVTPGAISALVRYLEDRPDVAFVYGDIYYMDENGQVIGREKFPDYTLLKLMLEKRRYPFPGCLMRRSVLDTVGYFDTDFRSADDLNYFIRIALHHKMGHLEQFTGYFRVHPQASTQARLLLHGEEIIQVYEKLLQSPDAPPEILLHEREIRGMAYYKAAYCCCRSGRAQQARTHVLRAFQCYPQYMSSPTLWVMLGLTLLGDRGMARAISALSASLRAFPPRHS